MRRLEMYEKQFWLDKQPLTILAGAVHYFRVVPEYWRDRLLKLKAAGLNTLETYVAWNVHEPQPGKFAFSGMYDLEAFVRLAAELDLHVLVRPGPYICSEWDMGGLPAWLLKDGNMQLRCSYQPYLDAVERFFDALIPRLVPLQSTHGGPILGLQVENEYGSYGNDQSYLRWLAQGLERRGIDVPLFTSDGGTDWMLQGGTLPDAFKTVNFGSRSQENFRKLQAYQPDLPFMCMEFWNGWFDHWGEEHHTCPAAEVAAEVDSMLRQGASINFYMFHGGTNFGFFNGANCFDTYEPTITSYDSHAPVGEAGELTEKYHAIREVLASHFGPVPDVAPQPTATGAYGSVPLTQGASLWEALPLVSQSFQRPTPVPMELLDQNYGYILYRTHITGPRAEDQLRIHGLHDRAHVFLDGQLQGTLYRNMAKPSVTLTIPPAGAQLDILVENMGRVNYGPHLADRKGITHGVQLAGQFLFDWNIMIMPLEDITTIPWQDHLPQTVPAFFRGTFNVDEPADTFVHLPQFQKGVCFVNGFNLGRYWNEAGPQQTLYLPGPILQRGTNELVVFETDRVIVPEVALVAEPMLG